MIEAIDRLGVELFLGSNSAIIDHVALILTNALTWIPMYLALVVLLIKNNDNMKQITLCFLFAILCPIVSSIFADIIVKPWVERLRPCNDPAVKYIAQIAGNMCNKDYSFFSAHAANTMSVAVYFILLVRSRLLSTTLIVWSLTNCWTRLYLGQHFVTDVLTGIAVGILVGISSYILYLRTRMDTPLDQRFVSSQYTSTGYSYIDIDIVVSVFALTVLFAFFP